MNIVSSTGRWVLGFICGLLAFQSLAQDLPPATVLFENVRIFNGIDSDLSDPAHVLVEGNLITRISASPIPVTRRADTRIIQGDGRILMPGLIDAHWHMAMAAVPMKCSSVPGSS